MLGSLSSSSHPGEDQEDDPTNSIRASASASSSVELQLRQLLVSCAELVSRSEYAAARRVLSFLAANSSPRGDATARLVHRFTNSLSLRLAASDHLSNARSDHDDDDDSDEAVRSSYLSLNQITPFVRFGHLTANQAILEATEGHRAVHVLDFDIMHGVQWPPLMQALVERYSTELTTNPNLDHHHDHDHHPPTLRITGTGPDGDVLRRTGDRLLKFAHSLGLVFRFHALVVVPGADRDSHEVPSGLALLPGEALAVNAALRLPAFLHSVRALNPRIVTVAGRVLEGARGPRAGCFADRFARAVDHYAAVFDSLEATVPPGSAERMAVERVWLGREIRGLVAAAPPGRVDGFESWEAAMRSSGFFNVALSPFALSQAKLLLRLHYPSEGYQIESTLNGSLVLSWRSRTLFSVSAWQ